MTDLSDLYKAAMPKQPEGKPKRLELRGLKPEMERLYSLWDMAEKPTEKAMEARRIVNRANR